MPYSAVFKRFKTLLRFDIAEHYRGIESGLNGLEIALNGIAGLLYIIDIQYYKLFGELGMLIANSN